MFRPHLSLQCTNITLTTVLLLTLFLFIYHINKESHFHDPSFSILNSDSTHGAAVQGQATCDWRLLPMPFRGVLVGNEKGVEEFMLLVHDNDPINTLVKNEHHKLLTNDLHRTWKAALENIGKTGQPGVFVEVGAGVGLDALFFATLPNAKTHAFEQQTDSRALLLCSIALSDQQIQRNIRVYPHIITILPAELRRGVRPIANQGKATISRPCSRALNTSSPCINQLDVRNEETKEANAITLDEWWKEMAGGGEVTLLHINPMSTSPLRAVLASGYDLFRMRPPLILSAPISSHNDCAFLRDRLGYTLFSPDLIEIEADSEGSFLTPEVPREIIAVHRAALEGG
ncbi:hypothetical protein HDV00_006527 [Rhizophlyctis rosea]|nr:hypothetical protein HDV00_006527 [Rhizophlyctis rosea]